MLLEVVLRVKGANVGELNETIIYSTKLRAKKYGLPSVLELARWMSLSYVQMLFSPSRSLEQCLLPIIRMRLVALRGNVR